MGPAGRVPCLFGATVMRHSWRQDVFRDSIGDMQDSILAVDADGTRLNVLDRGSGRPVILGHGYLFDHSMYDALAQNLERDHRVVRIDWRAHGASEMPRSSWDMKDQGEDYARTMDALEIDRAVVIGQSMGGMAALHLAMHRPHRLAGLVLIDTSANSEAFGARLKYAGLVLGVRLFGMRQWILNQAAATAFGPTFRAAHPDVVESWTNRWKRLDPDWVARTVSVPVARPSVIDQLATITAPTLVLYGDEDRTTPRRESRRLAETIPNARLEVLPKTGHMSPIEQPDMVGKLVRAFLEEIDW